MGALGLSGAVEASGNKASGIDPEAAEPLAGPPAAPERFQIGWAVKL
jgi:hypothetical protein